MKLLNALNLSFVTLLLLSGGILAQETQSETGPFWSSGTSGRDLFAEKPADGPAGLINASRYPFSVLAGIALEDMSSGTTELVPGGTDDGNSVLSPIGFLFKFDTINHTTFGASGNGFIKPGAVPAGPSNSNVINSMANTPKIMPYWDNIAWGTPARSIIRLSARRAAASLSSNGGHEDHTRGTPAATAWAGVTFKCGSLKAAARSNSFTERYDSSGRRRRGILRGPAIGSGDQFCERHDIGGNGRLRGREQRPDQCDICGNLISFFSEHSRSAD